MLCGVYVVVGMVVLWCVCKCGVCVLCGVYVIVWGMGVV